MSTKEAHTLLYWQRQLKKLNVETQRAVTAGELAKAVGQSVNTAKKWLNSCVAAQLAVSHDWKFKNGVIGKIYAVKVSD